MGGDKGIYVLILQSFAEENNSVGEQLATTIQAKEYTQGEQIVHKLKSSAGSIGAKNLHDVSVALQRALKEEDELVVAKLSMEFFDCLATTLAAIRKFMETGAR